MTYETLSNLLTSKITVCIWVLLILPIIGSIVAISFELILQKLEISYKRYSKYTKSVQ